MGRTREEESMKDPRIEVWCDRTEDYVPANEITGATSTLVQYLADRNVNH